MKNQNQQQNAPVGENDSAHRHGGQETDAASRAQELEKNVEAVHEAVFGAAPCSALPLGSTTEDVMNWISAKMAKAGLKRTR